MSHRAIVAIQRGEDTYDMYYSHNGAHEMQLLDQLQDQASALCQSSSQSAPTGFSTTSAPQLQQWDSASQQNPRSYAANMSDGINSDPLATDVPLSHVGIPLDFANIEAFYLVQESGVTPYVPVWLWPDVIRPIRHNLEIEVYRGGRRENDPEAMMERLESSDPITIIDGEALSNGAGWLSNKVITTVLRDHHAAIYALWDQMENEGVPQRLAEQADDGEKPDPSGVLHLDNYIVRFRVLNPDASPPPSDGLGLFVELPRTATGGDREQVWADGSSTRFNIGAGLNAMRATPDDDDIAEAMSDVFMELYETFGGRLSEHSPPPGGLIVRLLRKTVQDEADIEAAVEESNDLSKSAVRDLFTPGSGATESLDLPDSTDI